jgi:hypothetical protein
MDRSSFPNKQQDKSFCNYEKEEDLKPQTGGQKQSPMVISAGQTNADTDASYINSCMEDVCINGGSLVTYKKQIEKLYPHDKDFYAKCKLFLDEVNSSIKIKKWTNTSIKNLEYLGEEILLAPEMINLIVKYYQDLFEFEEEEKQKEEEEKRKKKETAIKKKEEDTRLERERIDRINRNYSIGTALVTLISLIAIAYNGWAIFISFATAIGASFVLTFWYKFIENNATAPKYMKIIIWIVGVISFILFFIIFFISHNWWSLFSILLIPVFAVIANIVDEGL